MNAQQQLTQEKSREYRKQQFWFFVVYLAVWPFFNLFRPRHIIGRENIPTGGMLICPNHSTNRDPFYVLYAFGIKYKMQAMAKVELMNVPFAGWILGKAGVFGVDRSATDTNAVKLALSCLKDGKNLMLFPEGRRVRKGEQVQAKTGAALFSTRTGAPIVPVYVKPRTSFFSRCTVVIGKAYHPEFQGRKATPEELEQITQDLMQRIYALEGEIK